MVRSQVVTIEKRIEIWSHTCNLSRGYIAPSSLYRTPKQRHFLRSLEAVVSLPSASFQSKFVSPLWQIVPHQEFKKAWSTPYYPMLSMYDFIYSVCASHSSFLQCCYNIQLCWNGIFCSWKATAWCLKWIKWNTNDTCSRKVPLKMHLGFTNRTDGRDY